MPERDACRERCFTKRRGPIRRAAIEWTNSTRPSQCNNGSLKRRPIIIKFQRSGSASSLLVGSLLGCVALAMAGASTSGGYQAVEADDSTPAAHGDVAKKVLEPDIPGHNELFNEENVSLQPEVAYRDPVLF